MSHISFQIYLHQTVNQVDELMESLLGFLTLQKEEAEEEFFQDVFWPANHFSHLTFSRILPKHGDIQTDFVYFVFPADW